MRTEKLLLMAAAILITGVFSCSKNEEGPSGPANGGGEVPDPEGTVLVSVRNSNNGGVSVDLPEVGSFCIDKSDNFVDDIAYGGVEFCSVGAVNGLGNIRVAPESGWASKVAVVKGYGYLVRRYNSIKLDYTYARMYVVDYIESVGGGVMGAYVKYQSPFRPENRVPSEKEKAEFALRFPDVDFRNFLIEHFDLNGDGVLNDKEVNAVARIDFSGTCDFQGLKYFSILQEFHCGEMGLAEGAAKHFLSALDVTGNNNLGILYVNGTTLSVLDLSRNMELNMLYCANNELTDILIAPGSALSTLFCHRNNLTSLDLSNAPYLNVLHCTDNELTELDVSGNLEIIQLECENNPLRLLWMKTGQKIAILKIPTSCEIRYR